MASQEEYSPEFKAKVAAEALAQDRKNLDKLSAKYDVPVSLILTWASKYEKDPESFETSDAPVDEAHESEEDTVVRVDVDDEEISEGKLTNQEILHTYLNLISLMNKEDIASQMKITVRTLDRRLSTLVNR
jgi:transposase-like protein